MAYESKGLRMVRSGIYNEWLLDTVDAVGTAIAAGYVTDGGPSALKTGRGLQVGDLVYVREVAALPESQGAPATVNAVGWAYVSAVNAYERAGPGGVGGNPTGDGVADLTAV